ncbi:uncharacterized protein BO66DRAFT_442942 [Aspergillus aculeatinus CBS 121060]|uniref:Uncharacterized protein n=1 Tax=Aspergillus aculeatinus CBS 121060 TaxID=1448322 RepID=A0ACD1GWL7_9EURO|nr:hypothetical protein BO66DRAFT_442942 [Aspergillus aculeatinus CBS 121060]RAH65536.1 hypothetical protein BO66DRAFT_442942 [Aspergillus aculeatinus CBS 121060]
MSNDRDYTSGDAPERARVFKLEDLPMDILLAVPALSDTLRGLLKKRCLKWALPPKKYYERFTMVDENGLPHENHSNWSINRRPEIIPQPFVQAIIRGHYQVVQNVLDAGVHPHRNYDLFGNSFWHIAVRTRNLQMIQIFLSHPEIDVNQKTWTGYQALDMLSPKQRRYLSDYYPALGRIIHSRVTDKPWTATVGGHQRIIRLLLEKGAVFSSADCFIHLVRRPDGPDLLRLTIRNGLYKDGRTTDWHTLYKHISCCIQKLSVNILDVIVQEIPEVLWMPGLGLMQDALGQTSSPYCKHASHKFAAYMIRKGFCLKLGYHWDRNEYPELAFVLGKLEPNPKFYGSKVLPRNVWRKWASLAELLLDRPELQKDGFEAWRDPDLILRSPLREALVARNWDEIRALLKAGPNP